MIANDTSVVLDPCKDVACPTCCHPRIVKAADRAIGLVKKEEWDRQVQRYKEGLTREATDRAIAGAEYSLARIKAIREEK